MSASLSFAENRHVLRPRPVWGRMRLNQNISPSERCTGQRRLHSCSPNVFVQNVFVDTHDPRFPWVAFFALCHIKAGTELTWNYNYDVLYCFCGAPNCRRRLLLLQLWDYIII
ncbi:unnamed protein product [Leptidea sinapis]|uniref:Post-SET domain-containing protein n=1 Tax=Leptidea sinapis TaxID=189913 RepID=A0A5E4QPR3_9NEOP|nr:unnamed protein product [Leptidea sinapis]